MFVVDDGRARVVESGLEQARAVLESGPEFFPTEQGLDALAELIATYRDDTEAAIRAIVEKALAVRADACEHRGQYTDAIACWDELIARYRSDPVAAARGPLASALMGKAVSFAFLGWIDEELSVLEEVITTFGADNDFATRLEVAWALYRKGTELGMIGREDDGIPIYERLIADYGTDPSPDMRAIVAHGFLGVADAHARTGHPAESLASYHQLIANYPDDNDDIQHSVAVALDRRAEILTDLGRRAEAVAEYENLIAFGRTAGVHAAMIARDAPTKLARLTRNA